LQAPKAFLASFETFTENSLHFLELEAPRVEPVFLEKNQAINYPENRACFRSREICILDSSGNVERVIPFNEMNRKL
jgi:hypothetical protein